MSVWPCIIYNNDVNNQQDTTFSFINLFKSTQNISGNKFTHLRKHFLAVYTAFGTMHRHCCRPLPRLRLNVSSMLIIRRSNFINTASGIVTLYKWPSDAPDGHLQRERIPDAVLIQFDLLMINMTFFEICRRL